MSTNTIAGISDHEFGNSGNIFLLIVVKQRYTVTQVSNFTLWLFLRTGVNKWEAAYH